MLVHVLLRGEEDGDEGEEFRHLAEGSGAVVETAFVVRRERRDPATFIGSGKVMEIAAAVASLGVELVLFDRILSPVQERNLERALGCRVVDRVGLILDIFARRARTHEGKLQVELAQLSHLRTRLVRGWTHLERQRGGIGLRGPGETQLETDRRLIGDRIRMLRSRLLKVAANRGTQRRARLRAPLPTVALVGYTNAGKSSLFNALSHGSSYTADQLFATLDPAIRRLTLPGHGTVLLADTVGFLRELPHELIAAFRATLEEVNQAQLLLHVVDASDPCWEQQAAAVESVLEEIGAAAIPRLLVRNKMDIAGGTVGIEYQASGEVVAVRVSALTGEGLPALLAVIAQELAGKRVRAELFLGPEEGALRARLQRVGTVLEETFTDSGGSHLLVDMDELAWRRLCARHGGRLSGCHAIETPPTMRVQD
ncbi:ribosome rescue GTPase HflX [Acidithiobacillus sp.]